MTDPQGAGPGAGPTWVDAHCHLPDDDVAADELLAQAASAGVAGVVTVGTDLASSAVAVRHARRRREVSATIGLHPHDATDGVDAVAALLTRELDADPTGAVVVAVGECGLDYHYDHSPRDVQRRVFAAQVGLAHQHGLPLVIHTREAWDDTFAVLDAEGTPPTTIFHCFTGGPAEAERCLERGALLSISGIVTFPSAADVRAAVERTPLDRLLVETDTPYLAPVPHRGRKNRPALVTVVGEKVAEVTGAPLAAVAAATTATARAAFRLPPPPG